MHKFSKKHSYHIKTQISFSQLKENSAARIISSLCYDYYLNLKVRIAQPTFETA